MLFKFNQEGLEPERARASAKQPSELFRSEWSKAAEKAAVGRQTLMKSKDVKSLRAHQKAKNPPE